MKHTNSRRKCFAKKENTKGGNDLQKGGNDLHKKENKRGKRSAKKENRRSRKGLAKCLENPNQLVKVKVGEGARTHTQSTRQKFTGSASFFSDFSKPLGPMSQRTRTVT